MWKVIAILYFLNRIIEVKNYAPEEAEELLNLFYTFTNNIKK